MMQSIYTLELDLHLFEGEGGDGGTGAAAEGAQQAPVYTSARAKKGADLSNVVYGKQTVTTDATDTQTGDAGQEHNGVQTTSNTKEEREAAYRNLMRGEYADLYARDMERTAARKTKENTDLHARLDAVMPTIQTLAQKYHVDLNDLPKAMETIFASMDDDVEFWAEEAAEHNMDVDAYKEYRRMERQNRELVEREARQRGESQAQQQLARWNSEAEQLRAKFPSFDLQREAQDPNFQAMLRSGVPMEHAYKVLHMDEIVNQERMTTAAATEERVVANVRARGARPKEAGNATSSAFVSKPDVNKLTKADRAEIARRAARGEKISF